MTTTHILDFSGVTGQLAWIEEGDPLTVPLAVYQHRAEGIVYRVNEIEMPLEVVMRHRNSMLDQADREGRRDELEQLLALHGLVVRSWTLPAGAEIREVGDE